MNARALIGKLSETSREGVETAASVAVAHRHYAVELEHLVIGLLRTESNQLAGLLAAYNLNAVRVIEEMERNIAHFDQGNTQAPAFSPRVIEVFKKAWMLSSLEYGFPAIASAACLVVLFKDESLRLLMLSRCASLQQADLDRIVREGQRLARHEFTSFRRVPLRAMLRTALKYIRRLALLSLQHDLASLLRWMPIRLILLLVQGPGS